GRIIGMSICVHGALDPARWPGPSITRPDPKEDGVQAVLVRELPFRRRAKQRGTIRVCVHHRRSDSILGEHLLPGLPRVEDGEVPVHDEIVAVDEDAIVDEDVQVGPEPVDERAAEIVGVERTGETCRVVRDELDEAPAQPDVRASTTTRSTMSASKPAMGAFGANTGLANSMK